MTEELYIGLMSGTSLDGVDALLARFTDSDCSIISVEQTPYPDNLLTDLLALIDNPETTSLITTGTLHKTLAECYAKSVADLLSKAGHTAQQIAAIGCHGQTVWHAPDHSTPFTTQLGDPGSLAVMTGIPVVADFRNADIAAGGQGAPLVPPFHQWAFGSAQASRAVINIGGIANITLLPVNGDTSGYDLGPGNTLLDQWARMHLQQPFDSEGSWAAGGNADQTLLDQLLADDYFARPAPKSTGPEYFNLHWLQGAIDKLNHDPAPQDVQATLSELTAHLIAQAASSFEEIAICGGGAANSDLMSRIKRQLPARSVQTTNAWGIDPHWVEAAAFAWLARQRFHSSPSSLPAVTGAASSVSLGGIYLPS